MYLDEISEAVEISSLAKAVAFLVVREDAQEHLIFVHSVLHFINELLVSLLTPVGLGTSVQVVHHHIS